MEIRGKVFRPRQEDIAKGWWIQHIQLTEPDPTIDALGWRMIPLGADPKYPERRKSYLFYSFDDIEAQRITTQEQPDMATRRAALAERQPSPDKIFDGTRASVSIRRRTPAAPGRNAGL